MLTTSDLTETPYFELPDGGFVFVESTRSLLHGGTDWSLYYDNPILYTDEDDEPDLVEELLFRVPARDAVDMLNELNADFPLL